MAARGSAWTRVDGCAASWWLDPSEICLTCCYRRETTPAPLAKKFGWDALLEVLHEVLQGNSAATTEAQGLLLTADLAIGFSLWRRIRGQPVSFDAGLAAYLVDGPDLFADSIGMHAHSLLLLFVEGFLQRAHS